MKVSFWVYFNITTKLRIVRLFLLSWANHPEPVYMRRKNTEKYIRSKTVSCHRIKVYLFLFAFVLIVRHSYEKQTDKERERERYGAVIKWNICLGIYFSASLLISLSVVVWWLFVFTRVHENAPFFFLFSISSHKMCHYCSYFKRLQRIQLHCVSIVYLGAEEIEPKTRTTKYAFNICKGSTKYTHKHGNESNEIIMMMASTTITNDTFGPNVVYTIFREPDRRWER